MESELYFEWPHEPRPNTPWAASTYEPPPEADDTAPETDDSAPEDRVRWREARELQLQLDEARATIVRVEADRHAARVRIEELEAARDTWQERLTAQRRRLLVLERQLEAAQLTPADDRPPPRASWLDRLLGGRPPAPTRVHAPRDDESLSTL